MRAKRRHQKVAGETAGSADQVSTNPDRTKKKVTPWAPRLSTSATGSGARFVMWCAKTPKAAHHRRPVSASRRTGRTVRPAGWAGIRRE